MCMYWCGYNHNIDNHTSSKIGTNSSHYTPRGDYFSWGDVRIFFTRFQNHEDIPWYMMMYLDTLGIQFHMIFWWYIMGYIGDLSWCSNQPSVMIYKLIYQPSVDETNHDEDEFQWMIWDTEIGDSQIESSTSRGAIGNNYILRIWMGICWVNDGGSSILYDTSMWICHCIFHHQ